MMGDFEASDKLKLCDFEDDNDVPFSPRFSPISSFATCNCKHNASVKMWDTTSMPVKREFDNNNSLDISVKKSKVLPDDGEEDDVSLSQGESALVEKSFKKCERKRRFEENRLKSINRKITECSKELANKKTQISCVRRIHEIYSEVQVKVERKEEELNALSQKIAECTMELETTKKELQSERKKLLQVISTRQKHNDCDQVKNFESMKKKFEGQVKELESKLKQCEGQVEELEQNKKHFDGLVKALESRDKQLEGCMMEFELMEEELESREKELESKEKIVEGRMVEFELTEEELESRKKKLESKEKLVESREVKLKSKENQLESREKNIETKEKRNEDQEKDFESRLKDLQSKENQFVGRVKEFESEKAKFEVNLRALWVELMFKQKQIYCRTRMIESKQKHQEVRVKKHQSKEREFEDRMKELEFEKKNLESQVEDFKEKQKQLQVRWEELDSKENKFKVKEKKHELKKKQFERQVKEFVSKLNKFDAELKEPELRGKQYEASMKHIDEEKESGATLRLSVTEVGSDMNDQLSPAIGGVESLFNDIFFNLQISSDPSELVLDILKNPNTPLYKNEDKVLIINDSHIYLLELLMLISPNVKPCVREEALKLALDLKANMKANTENSLAVVSFLLLLSVYGLLSYFNGDEVLELFTFVAQHKIALKMFGTLGFANKVSDFVETLIRRKQFVGAVRFSCAYNLAGKNQLVDMLREHVQNAKLICERSCEKTNSIEIKDKARDEEIASLRTVLQCISDNNIVESEDLLKKEIRHRILELKAQKGN